MQRRPVSQRQLGARPISSANPGEQRTENEEQGARAPTLFVLCSLFSVLPAAYQGSVSATSFSSGALRSRSESCRSEPGPLDPNVGIVVADACLGLRDVVPGALVDGVGDVAGDEEAVREAHRDVDHPHVLVGQLEALPTARTSASRGAGRPRRRRWTRAPRGPASPARGRSGSASRAARRATSASGCPGPSRGRRRARSAGSCGTSPRRSHASRRAPSPGSAAGRPAGSEVPP